MIYKLPFEKYPSIEQVYKITRTTVWQSAESMHIIILIYQGSCSIEINGKKQVLNEGDCMFIPKNTMYIRRPENDMPCTMYYVHFDMPLNEVTLNEAKEIILEQNSNLGHSLFSKDSIYNRDYTGFILEKISLCGNKKSIEDKFDKTISIFGDYNVQTPLYASIEVSEILLELSSLSSDQLIKNTDFSLLADIPVKLRTAIVYIKQHFAEKITLEDLCAHCSVSKQQMIRYFKNCLDTTPIAFIIDYKISKACELLRNPAFSSIKEISYELGFENQCYFSRVFTKIKGESPTGFRNRVVNFDKK
mgnify:CR=1 FL=1